MAEGASIMTDWILHSTSGPDGKLYLEVPVGKPDTEFEVEVVVRPKHVSDKRWPPGYFDLFGAIDDETFVRAPQGRSRARVDAASLTDRAKTGLHKR